MSNTIIEHVSSGGARSRLSYMEFWSETDPDIAVNAVAADASLPNIVVAGLPSGAVVKRCLMEFRHGKRVESGGAGNATVSAQVMSIDSASGRGSVVTAINVPDNSFHTAANATEYGLPIIGDNDVSAEVTGNGTFYPTWELADVDAASLTFHDVQVGLLIWYSL